MKSSETIIALAVTGLLAAGLGTAQAQDVSANGRPATAKGLRAPAPLAKPHRLQLPRPVIITPETVSTPNAGFASTSVFSSRVTPAVPSTTLTPPLTLSYSGNSPTLLIEDSGSNKGLEALITNTKNAASAVYGQTNGSGAGVTGYNVGTEGPAGKFLVTNPNSTQPGVYASTTGVGSAIYATNTTSNTTAQDYQPAIYAENLNHSKIAAGILGVGTATGVEGSTASDDTIESTGLAGYATLGQGLTAYSYSGTGASIFSQSGTGASISGGQYGVYTESSGAASLYAYNDGPGGIGVYAESEFGLAGEFEGDVHITGTLTVGTTSYSSDRRLKQDLQPVDGRGVLDKIDQLPVTSWDYKSDPQRRHVGPMAQDFHAAFGLNGDDETHISEVDIAGISLAAIKELNTQMRAKDAQIADLKAQLAAQARATADMQATMRLVTSQLASYSRQQAAGAQTAALRLISQ